jgi:chromosome segregation ATPase
LEEARAKLQSVAEEFSVTHVQSQIDDAVSRAASMHTRALADLQEKLDAVVGEKATLQAAAERAGEELRAERDHSEKTEEEMTSKLQDLESTNKKLFAKLKVVMKEVTDMKESSVKVTEEKEALQSSLKDTAYQLQSVRDESAFAQGESDSLRRRIAELEELAKTKTQKEKRLTDAVGALNTKINELTVVCNDAKARLQVAEKEADEAKTALEANMIQKDLQGNFEAEEKVAAAVSAAKNMREKAEHYKNLCETLKKEKEGSDAKVDVLVDKIKRMKSLLTNAKSQKQKEREEKERKDSKSLNPEQRILSVLATISLPSGVEDDSPVQSWCLVLDDGDDDDDEDVVAEWVEEPIVRSWLDDGAKLSGEWPESLQDAWSREMNEIKSALEEEREAVNRELEETTKNFNTYKTRAQLAMKRMGQDDREERRAFLAEGECIQELNEEINQLKKRLEESSSARKDDMDKRRELVTKLKAALEQVQTLRGKLDKETQRATSLQETVDTLNAAKSNLVMASHTQSRERGGSGNMDTKGDSMNAEHHRSSSFNAPTPPAQADDPMSPAPGDDWESDFSVGDDGDDDDDDDGDEKDDDDDDDDSKHLKAGRENDDEEVEGEDGSEDGDQNASTGSYEVSSGCWVSYHQTLFDNLSLYNHSCTQVDDDEGYRILVYYRDENARLEKELTESTDEISSMKESLVELEHSLRREKEFNAPSNRVNAEYLVNVLRKFFLCDDENERSQLVVAVTQILHLLPDECKIITEKWAVKTKPRGWFG